MKRRSNKEVKPLMDLKQKKRKLDVSVLKDEHLQTKKVFKILFDSPYIVKWPIIEKEHQESVFIMLCDYIEKQMRRQHMLRMDPSKYSYRQRKPSRIPPPEGILCGINAVTRGLEQEKVKLVIVFKNEVNPLILIQHVLVMAKVKGAALCVFSIGSLRLRHLLHVNTLAAMAFVRKQPDQEEFDSLFEKISTVLPEYSIPWLEDALLRRTIPEWTTYLPTRLKILETTMPIKQKKNHQKHQPLEQVT
jgi:ribosomal protein L7Ae-like RNA K-turn-binding protein